MVDRRSFLILALSASACAIAGVPDAASEAIPTEPAFDLPSDPEIKGGKIEKLVKTEAEWKAVLTPIGFQVLRQEGTDRPFTGPLWDNHLTGMYACAGCGLSMFSSTTKFESGTGWPSFTAPVKAAHIQEHTDRSMGMARTELKCARCDGHLGHVFPDGPKPTGLRYCIDTASLIFRAA